MLSSRYTGCVYLATNTVNGAVYIGKTISRLCDRRASHITGARRKAVRSAFHSALRKYGPEKFVWSVLYVSDEEDALFEAERALIVDFRAAGVRLYNIGDGGEGQSIPCSEERRAKVSHAMQGRSLSADHRRKLSEAAKGRPKSARHVANMRLSKTGAKLPPWSDGRRAKHAKSWAAKLASDYSVSEETRRKMSEAAKRRSRTEEGRLNARAAGLKGADKRWSR